MKNKILFSFIVLAGMAVSSAMAQVLPSKQETLKTLTLVEELLADFFERGTKVLGRLSGALPRKGELNPDHILKALGKEIPETLPVPENLVGRPPSLCAGCGHQDTYLALNEVVQKYGNGRVFSDIGCYTLGALPPYNTINTCVDMGASITMAKGAADAGLEPVFAVIGDSTFTHSGMTGLS